VIFNYLLKVETSRRWLEKSRARWLVDVERVKIISFTFFSFFLRIISFILSSSFWKNFNTFPDQVVLIRGCRRLSSDSCPRDCSNIICRLKSGRVCLTVGWCHMGRRAQWYDNCYFNITKNLKLQFNDQILIIKGFLTRRS